ncbi:hypothetical protein PsYK624_044400 [Phanerochaete sordida]|uniref:Uncharacterized protein n=1 Tax=Phanerochaete sordida TaxID=48140 RepID=A0A9P3G3D9_9APHY|nr:hypothetical protein PsYK624_044400 [Phanerochaete sordida]
MTRAPSKGTSVRNSLVPLPHPARHGPGIATASSIRHPKYFSIFCGAEPSCLGIHNNVRARGQRGLEAKNHRNIGPILSILPVMTGACGGAGYILNIIVEIAGEGLTAIFSALRVYAIWHESNSNRILAGIVFMLLAVPVATNLFALSRTIYVLGPGPSDTYKVCSQIINVSPIDNEIIAANTLVLVLTWIKSFRQYYEMRQLRVGASVTAILLRDGTVHFLALLFLSVLKLLAFTPGVGLLVFEEILLGTLWNPMPLLLVQRFILNLRQLNPENQTSAEILQGPSRLSFSFRMPSNLIGNIGEDLDHGQSELPLGEEEEATAEPDQANIENVTG